MFNRNTFLQHTINTTNHNKITNAGVKAPFSMNEQAFVFPTMYSGDERTDVPRTGSPGKGNPVIKMNPTGRQATPYNEELHSQAHYDALQSGERGDHVQRKHDPMGFHIDRAVDQWRQSGSKPGQPSDVNKMDIARGHFHNYVSDLMSNGNMNQMYRPNMNKDSSFYQTHFKQFLDGMSTAHSEME